MAALTMLARLRNCLYSFEEICSVALGFRFPKHPPVLSAIVVGHNKESTAISIPTERDFGFLWAVPRNRRTIERRWKRKFGNLEYNWKPFIAKTNIIVCNVCGHDYEAGALCGHCYEKVAEETRAAQDAVIKKLGLSAIDREVVLVYDGEPSPQDQTKKMVVEVPRRRPPWFSRNLLERSTDVPAPSALSTETEAAPIQVKPSELG